MAHESVQLAKEQQGFKMHRVAYLLVIPLLALINLAVVPEFLWFLFPMIGWGIGLLMHYLFGLRRLERLITEGPYSEQTIDQQRR